MGLEGISLIRICKEIKTSTETQFHPICVKNKFTAGNTPQEICFSWLLPHISETQPVLSSGLCKHSSLIKWMEKAKCLCGLGKKKKSLFNDTQTSMFLEGSSYGTSCSDLKDLGKACNKTIDHGLVIPNNVYMHKPSFKVNHTLKSLPGEQTQIIFVLM